MDLPVRTVVKPVKQKKKRKPCRNVITGYGLEKLPFKFHWEKALQHKINGKVFIPVCNKTENKSKDGLYSRVVYEAGLSQVNKV